MGISKSIHEDSYADAWESTPFEQRRELLRKVSAAGMPKYLNACARARWCDLPADVQQSVRNFMDPALVLRCSEALIAREQA